MSRNLGKPVLQASEASAEEVAPLASRWQRCYEVLADIEALPSRLPTLYRRLTE